MVELLATLVVFGAILVIFLKEEKRKKAETWKPIPWGTTTRPASAKKPAYRAKRVMTEVEQKLYHRLRRALPNRVVLAQVGLSRIIESTSDDIGEFRAISQKSVDYLVLAADSSVIAAIELDDSSHNKRDRKKADATKDAALASAGVRMIRWHVRNIPDVEAIQIEINGPEEQTSPPIDQK